MNRRACYIGFLLCLVVVAAGLVPLTTLAQGLTFTTGEKLSHQLSVCIEKQDAVDILDAHRKGGREAAEAAWQAKDKCANVNVMQGSVGKVVYAIKANDTVYSVVEIVIDGKVAAYFVTSSPVNKAQRNT
jgi:hypothetical protein